MRGRRVARGVAGRIARPFLVVGAVVAVLLVLVGIDSAWTAATHPARQTHVVKVSDGVPDAPTYDPASGTVFLNGLGLDVSVAQARALSPSVGRYGPVYALEYASIFSADAAADTIRDALRATPDAPAPVHLTVVTSSMGDVRGFEIIASLQQRHRDVHVVGFVVNTGPGPGKRVRVKGGELVQTLLDHSCTPFVPGSVLMGIVEVANQAAQSNVADAASLARAYDQGTRYRGRVVINQLCSLTRPSALAAPPRVPYTVYLGTGHPGDDVVVDWPAAYADWQQVLPGMDLLQVAGATHDNIHFRPDLFNPVFTDKVMPRIRFAQRVHELREDDRPGPTPTATPPPTPGPTP